jgi:ketosteroid isomerase-like protein
MLEQDDSQRLHDLLQTHRRILAHYLQQKAGFGTAYTPPHVAEGIREARANIRQIKSDLKKLGVVVTDALGDEEHAPLLQESYPNPRESKNPLIKVTKEEICILGVPVWSRITTITFLFLIITCGLGGVWSLRRASDPILSQTSVAIDTTNIAILPSAIIPPPTVTPTSASICQFQSNSDKATITRIIEAEADAVKTEDIEIIRSIFAPSAVIMDAVNGEVWRDPISRYRTLFNDVDFSEFKHYDIRIVRQDGDTAYFISSSIAKYKTAVAPENTITITSSSNDHWTLAKNSSGCWFITNYTFNAVNIPFP